MKSKLTWVLTLFLVLIMSFSFAQEKTISGTVTDQSGLPLPGVSVLVVGTTKGTQTDFDGNYTITASTGQQLRFSYVGQKTSEALIGTSSTINVQLEEDSQALEEVVVVAYGKQKKEAIVGSIATVGVETIEKQKVTSITQAIQGSVPGVNIITSGGVPGENATIRIRGIGSINASAEPLIILDGSPYNGNLNNISQDQIESITVLKDASSTALYGSRGANGVIVLTTKGGELNSAPVFTVSTSYGVSKNAVDFHPLVGAADYMKYSWEALRNANQYIDGNDAATAGQYATDNLLAGLGYNPYNIDNPIDANGNLVSGATLLWDTDWKDALLRKNGTRTEHGMTVSGGSEKTSYFASLNYLNQDGNVKTTKFERVAARMKIDSKVTNWLKIGANMAYTTSTSNIPTQSGSSFQSAVQWFYSVASVYPIYRRDSNGDFIYDDNGSLIYDYGNNTQTRNGNRAIFSGENGLGALYNYDLKFDRYNTDLSGYADFTITDYLSFKSTLSYQNYLFDQYQYISDEFGYAANVKGRVSQNRDITKTMNAIQALSFNKDFGKHNINVDAIYEAYSFKYDALGAQGVGFLPNVKVLDGSTTPEGVSGSFTDETLSSVLGRVGYNYGEKYFIEGSYRRDGSSRFAEDVRFGDFYSVGGSWIVSRENFLANSNFLSYLKLKGSYGELGNNQGIGYFPYLSVFDTGYNQLGNTGVLQGGVSDPNLSWEKTASLNYGVEFGLFKGRLNGSVEFYEKESVDLIYDKPLPISTGNSSITTNVGALKNTGIEVSLNADLINNKDFSWSAGLNFSFDDNEITELTQEEFINGNKKWKVGRSLYDYFIQEWAGVDPADGYGMWYKDILDVDGEPTGERETTKVYADATRYYNDKSSLPDVIGGFNTSLRYKNWDFNTLINFSFGSYIVDGTYQSLMGGFESAGRAAHTDIADRWQQPGDITDVPLILGSNNDFNAQSTRFLYKNDYLRVRALSLGYSFGDRALDKIGMSSLRFYVQGDNLFTFQSHDGIDPEQSLAGSTNSRSYQLATISFGINAKF